MEVGLAGVGWREVEKMQTIVTELKNNNNERKLHQSGKGK